MKKLPLLFFILSIGLGPCVQLAAKDKVATNEFVVTDTMRAEVKYVVNTMEKEHYAKKALKNLDSRGFIDFYLKSLDPYHLWLTQAQVDGFYIRFEKPMQQYLGQGNPYPGFEIFKEYRHSLRKRMEWILKRLAGNFSLDSSAKYMPDRKNEPWPRSVPEADKLWDKKLQYEIINEMISDDADESDTKKKKKAEKEKSPKEKLAQAIENVQKRYERHLKTIEDFEAVDVQEIFLSAYTRMHDPHSVFFSADSLEDFSMSLHSSLVGIGAVLTIEDGYCTIKELLPGGPAEKSKQVKANDAILAVAQGDGPMFDVVGLSLRKTIKHIRGKEGTVVRLLIRPGDGDPSERKTVKLVRDEIKLTYNLVQGRIYDMNQGSGQYRVGFIDIPSFYMPDDNDPNEPNVTKDVKEVINKMKGMGVEGIVIDLRRNGGGFLSEAISLTGLFIPVGPVVQVKDSRGQVREFLDMTTGITWTGPLAILVSENSASASEIFAGALKSYNRAMIVGDESTHGKGTVQIMRPIDRRLWQDC